MRHRIICRLIVAIFLSTVIFSGCTKDHIKNIIQEGPTTIEINAIYPLLSNSHSLQVRYNNVIDAPINATIAFHLGNGQEKHVSVTIPAGYKNLQEWGNGGFINSWDYTENNYDSTTNASPSKPEINPEWSVESVAIISVTCPDNQYGFKVLTGSDEWTYYHPIDSLTTVRFIVNKDTISYSDYDFKNANGVIYRPDATVYGLYLFDYRFQMISDSAEIYPLKNGMSIKMPFLLYYWNRNWGSQLDQKEVDSNGSTLKLIITKMTDTHFDAVFSGKIWSSRQPDTLFITNGEIKHALLPVITQ